MEIEMMNQTFVVTMKATVTKSYKVDANSAAEAEATVNDIFSVLNEVGVEEAYEQEHVKTTALPPKKWSSSHKNPFYAISEIAKPGDYAKAKDVLANSADLWETWDMKSYLDDVLADIATSTGIIVQVELVDDCPVSFRAAYDNDL
jgi:hypothetical protein